MTDLSKIQKKYAAWQQINTLTASSFQLQTAVNSDNTKLSIKLTNYPPTLTEDSLRALLWAIKTLTSSAISKTSILTAALEFLEQDTTSQAIAVRDTSAADEAEAQAIITAMGGETP